MHSLDNLHTFSRQMNFYSSNLDSIFQELELAYVEFINAHVRYLLSSRNNFLFVLAQIAKHPEISFVRLEQLLEYQKKVKHLFLEKDYYNKVFRQIYKRILKVNNWNRTILFSQKMKVAVETGLLILTGSENLELEDLSDSSLNVILNLAFLPIGFDYICPIDVEIINLPKPILSLSDYKKEIISQTDFVSLDVKDGLYIFDGVECNKANFIQLVNGQYLACIYQFENKIKVVLSNQTLTNPE